jgi:hypothetical protein
MAVLLVYLYTLGVSLSHNRHISTFGNIIPFLVIYYHKNYNKTTIKLPQNKKGAVTPCAINTSDRIIRHYKYSVFCYIFIKKAKKITIFLSFPPLRAVTSAHLYRGMWQGWCKQAQGLCSRLAVASRGRGVTIRTMWRTLHACRASCSL